MTWVEAGGLAAPFSILAWDLPEGTFLAFYQSERRGRCPRNRTRRAAAVISDMGQNPTRAGLIQNHAVYIQRG
jgi:hypothetical protein